MLRLFSACVLIFSLFNNLLLAKFTPPPPSISYYDTTNSFEYDRNWNGIDNYRIDLGKVTLAGSNNRLSVSGGYTPHDSNYIVERLIVGSDSIITFYWEEDPSDPGGVYYPSLVVNDLELIGKSALILEGYVSFWIKDTGDHIWDYLNHIKIIVGNELRNTRWERANGYYYISGDAPWTPVPEPSTYGAILSAATLGVAFYRKQKKRSITFAALA